MELEINSLLTPSLKDCTVCELNSMVQNKKQMAMGTKAPGSDQRGSH